MQHQPLIRCYATQQLPSLSAYRALLFGYSYTFDASRSIWIHLKHAISIGINICARRETEDASRPSVRSLTCFDVGSPMRH
jgi:hypothetical protein